MTTLFKTSALVVGIALLLSLPASNANAGTHRECYAAYRECILAGFPEVDCETGYWLCRYGYLPVKSGRTAMIDNPRD